jgi:hypothetical protein
MAWSVSEVADFVARFEGEKFMRASEICAESDVDGKTLVGMSREDIEDVLGFNVLEAQHMHEAIKYAALSLHRD